MKDAEPIEYTGKKYRKCVAAVVFNQDGLVLVGERVKVEGSWQLPQGGVDAAETLEEAAARELYEEMGIKTGKDENQVECLGTVSPPCEAGCYNVTSGWLKDAGYAGQHLSFVSFFSPHSLTPVLTGLNGEPQEFTQTKWMEFPSLAKSVWGPKQPAYEFASSAILPKFLMRLKK
eukprot:TRINITY_DN7590_c0_g1_i2.p1 TRINITY_DN7590_c0_g1~~TRINITY_DN7590_c0_g1_i2.p1  ORF type:complete len:175 (+),score=30.04 TRINITY_DN7590_c0_g1_i2:40-564(+)